MVPTEILKEVRFFHDIAEDLLKRIAGIAELRDAPAGTIIFREGGNSSFVYVVQNGLVSLEIRVSGRGSVQIQTVGPGELLGWSPILETGPMTATARCGVPSRLIALQVPQLLALCKHDPILDSELMRRTALALDQRLKATRLQLLDVYRHEMQVMPHQEGGA
jgi:CRP-like cAMP-binding protein